MKANGRTNNMNKTILAILIAATLAAATTLTAFGQGGKQVHSRQVWTTQPLTTSGASNSTVIVVERFKPIGNYAAELRVRGTGTVDYVYVQLSQDNSTWYNAALVMTNTAFEVDTADAPTGSYTNLVGLLPPAPFYRLRGAASVNTPLVSAWFILH